MVVPRYRMPYPAEPTYLDATSGERRAVPQPVFGPSGQGHEAYLRLVSAGQRPARAAHGVLHAARVTLFAQALIRLYVRAGRTPVRDAFGAAMAAAFHDVARQDEGEDRWDGESAEQLAACMRSLGTPLSHIDVLRHAVATKDPAILGEDFSSDEQRIVHDADCLDLVRVLQNPGDFRRDELAFYRFEGLDADVRDELVDEATDVVFATEDPALGLYLEQRSPHAYEDLVGVLVHVESRQRRWPLLADLWADVFAQAGLERLRFLYHGSLTPGLAMLEPRKRFLPGGVEASRWPALVYASELPAFAAAHAFPWDSAEGFLLSVSGDARVSFSVPELHRNRLQQPMCVYQVPAENFTWTAAEHTGHTYHNDRPILVISCAQFRTVEEAIEHYDGIVQYVRG